MPATTPVPNPVIAALLKAKENFGPLTKDANNPFHKSKYASLDSVNKAVDAALMESGLCVTNNLLTEDGKTFVVSRLLHTSGEFDPTWQESRCPLLNASDSQKLGSAITYARRYNKVALLDLVADEDDDGNASTRITAPQKTRLKTLMSKHGWSIDEITKIIKAKGFVNSAELTLTAYKEVCEELESRQVKVEDSKA